MIQFQRETTMAKGGRSPAFLGEGTKVCCFSVYVSVKEIPDNRVGCLFYSPQACASVTVGIQYPHSKTLSKRFSILGRSFFGRFQPCHTLLWLEYHTSDTLILGKKYLLILFFSQTFFFGKRQQECWRASQKRWNFIGRELERT